MIYQYLLHPDGSDEFIYVSSGCWELYELEPEQIQENSDLMWSMVHPEDLKPMLESVAISGETLKPWIYEGRIVTRSGKLKWIRGIARPELQPGGDILWEGVTIDISDRKLAEIALSESKMALQQANQELEKRVLERTEALQTSKKMLWSVINNIPQLIAWKDRDLVYLGGNKNFAKVAGFNHPSEIAGSHRLRYALEARRNRIFSSLRPPHHGNQHPRISHHRIQNASRRHPVLSGYK